eukprot:scaffold259_cov578-Prasinococcus_capsulatus_cf.AAC.1
MLVFPRGPWLAVRSVPITVSPLREFTGSMSRFPLDCPRKPLPGDHSAPARRVTEPQNALPA